VKGKRADRPDPAEKNDDAAAPGAAPVAPAEAATPAADTTIKTYERIIVTESVKHTFTTHELAAIADQMGSAASHVFRIESEKAEQTARYTALLKAANLTHAELVGKYNLRYEMRDVECRVEYDKPEPGYKSFVRTDNGESVKELRMTEAERQRAFVFDAGDGKPQ
jgi:hypothetical protein